MIGNVLILAAYTLAAWLVHIVLETFYMNLLPDTKSLTFRSIHAIEIGLTVSVMILFYLRNISPQLSSGKALITILGTLLLVDAIALFANSSMRDKFDWLHFLTAYTVIALLSLLLIKSQQ